MSYQVFVSYARSDDADGRVGRFVDALSLAHRVLTGENLSVFFDRSEIKTGQDWRLRLHESLRQSSSLIALLSPAYLVSEYCHLEWTMFERHMAVGMALDEGIRPLVVVPLGDFDSALASSRPAWMAPDAPSWSELLGPVQRSGFDLMALSAILTEEHIRQRLSELTDAAEHDPEQGVLESIRWVRRLDDRRRRAATSTKHGFPSMNRRFVGRVRELREIRTALATCTEVAISAEGMAGIGKTELAVAYAHAFAWDYPAGRWFLPSEGQVDLSRFLADALALGLGFEIPELAAKEPDGGFGYVRRYLESLPEDKRKVLVVLDNVDQDELVSTESMRSLGVDPYWFDLLVTSRHRLRSGEKDSYLRTVRVGRLSDEELLTLLSVEKESSQADLDAAGILLVQTDGLTLAVEIAAAYLRLTGVGIAEYVSALEKQGALLTGLATTLSKGAAKQISHQEKYLDRIFRTSMARLSEGARVVLGIASLLPPDMVPMSWLERLACVENESLSITELVHTGFEEALRELQDLSLLEAPESGGRTCRIHRLVAESARLGSEAQIAARDAKILELINGELSDRDWYDSELRWQLEPMTQWLSGRKAEDEVTLRVLHNVGTALFRMGNAMLAEPNLMRVAEVRERVLGAEHPDTLTSVHSLGGLLQDKGDLVGAEELYRRVLVAREHVLGLEHPDTLSSVNNLGGLLSNKGDLVVAEESYRRVLAARERVLGIEHPDTLSSLNSLGGLLQDKGDLVGAEELYRRVLVARERILGREHPDTLTSLNNLGGLLRNKGDHVAAEELCRRALAALELVLGLEHPFTLTSLRSLGGLLANKGDLVGAEELYRRVLEAQERILGIEHPSTLTSLRSLGGLLANKGDLVGAKELYRRVLEAQERILGIEHPSTLTSLNNLGLLLSNKGDLVGAEEIFRRVLEASERVLGIEHPDTLSSVNNLGGLLSEKGDLVSAESLHRRALQARERVLGIEHPSTLISLSNLGGLLSNKGDLVGAEELYRRVLEAQERILGPEHPYTLTSVNRLGLLLKNKGDLVGAEPMYRRAFETCERILGPEHPSTLTNVNNLGVLLTNKGDLVGAELLYRRALESRERILGAVHPDTFKSRRRLKRLLETRRIVDSIRGRMDCERCLGTGFVSQSDIVRLGIHPSWRSGPCQLCREASGLDDKN